MPEITVRQAIREALDEEMERDKSVFIMGEEVGEYQGAYKISQGLLEKYGPGRVIDTPISEEGFTGIGVGAALAGLRPVVEWMTFNFGIQALDQVYNNAAKYLYMSGGMFPCPMVIRGPNGPAEYLAAQHSQALQTVMMHCPGLKVVAPSSPADAKGLLKTAIRDDNPVMVLESEMMYSWKGEVPEGEHLVPFGKAAVKRTGSDCTILTYSKPIRLVMEAAEFLSAQEDVEIEVVDLRSLRPLDEDAIYASVRKTNACVVVDEAWPVCGPASYIASLIQRNCFDDLDAPVETVTMEDVPMPYNHGLELEAQPSTEKIVAAVKKVLYL